MKKRLRPAMLLSLQFYSMSESTVWIQGYYYKESSFSRSRQKNKCVRDDVFEATSWQKRSIRR